MTNDPRLVILISGSGSNLQAIIEAVATGRLPVAISLVVSNRKAAYGLVRAAEQGISTIYHPLKPYREAGQNREAYEADLAAMIESYQPELIVLAGWMHVLGAAFLEKFAKKVINLHPALPGQFAGTQAIERAFQAYQDGEIKGSGCMVHYAVPEIDAGPVIIQADVPIFPADDLLQFETRMHETEHRIIVEAIQRFFKW